MNKALREEFWNNLAKNDDNVKSCFNPLQDPRQPREQFTTEWIDFLESKHTEQAKTLDGIRGKIDSIILQCEDLYGKNKDISPDYLAELLKSIEEGKE